MKIYSNKGMFLETLINQTALYFESKNIALIFKRNLPIDIYKVDEKKVNGILKSKSLTDYYGIYNGIYIDFEAKQTINDFFQLSNLKDHQLLHLNNVLKNNGISFIILYFVKLDEFYIIETSKINNLIENGIKKIDADWCDKNAFKLIVVFPTHLNIDDYLKMRIKND